MAYYILLLFYPHYIRKTCPPSIKLLWFSGPSTLTHDISLFQYPLVIKHGLLECPLFIADFPNKTLPFMEDFTIFSHDFTIFSRRFSVDSHVCTARVVTRSTSPGPARPDHRDALWRPAGGRDDSGRKEIGNILRERMNEWRFNGDFMGIWWNHNIIPFYSSIYSIIFQYIFDKKIFHWYSMKYIHYYPL